MDTSDCEGYRAGPLKGRQSGALEKIQRIRGGRTIAALFTIRTGVLVTILKSRTKLPGPGGKRPKLTASNI